MQRQIDCMLRMNHSLVFLFRQENLNIQNFLRKDVSRLVKKLAVLDQYIALFLTHT